MAWPFHKSSRYWTSKIYKETRVINDNFITLDQALENFVVFKDEIDLVKWNYNVRDRSVIGYLNQLPENFLEVFLPFFSTEGQVQLTNAIEISPNQAVGYDSINCSHTKAAIDFERRVRPADFLDNLNADTLNPEILSCRGYRINGLNLIYLIEGLSRPQLAREVDRPFYCEVGTVPYRAIGDLILHNYNNWYFLIEDRNFAETELILLPRYIIPIFRALGIIEEYHHEMSFYSIYNWWKFSKSIKSNISHFIKNPD